MVEVAPHYHHLTKLANKERIMSEKENTRGKMSCQEFKKSIDSYIEHELSEQQINDFEAHFIECSFCLDEIQMRANAEDSIIK